MIVVVDYGMGNLGSVRNMLRKLGADVRVSSDPALIHHAEKLVLPGVGAFDQGMRGLEVRGLLPVLHEKVVEHKAPILGICLGMQLFARRSEEGALPGLGWLDAEVVRFSFPQPGTVVKVPHMGWNTVEVRQDHPLFAGFDGPPRFYFVHSYHMCCHDPRDVLATSAHGGEFTAAVARGNILATQFHPEKSHSFGLRLLGNFSAL